MTRRVVLFNGPPSCGKDTAALECFGALTGKHYMVFDRMSMPIKRAFASIIQLNIDWKGNVEHWEARKEETIPGFGCSYRQWQIDFSEKFMKPLYGEAIFGKLFISRNKRQSDAAIILVPDCGFNIEYETLAAHYGKENILVVKIYRKGFSFEKDSRSYLSVGSNFILDDPSPGSNTFIHDNVAYINNCESKKEFETKVYNIVRSWLNVENKV